MKTTRWRFAIFVTALMLACNFTITCPIPGFECDTAVGVAAARAAV